MDPSEISSQSGLQIGRVSEDIPLCSLPSNETTSSDETCVKMDPTPKTCCPNENSRNDGAHSSNDDMTEVKKLDEEASYSGEDARSDGNWTVENAKHRLKRFLQEHNIKSDYSYSVVTREGCSHFVAELSIYVEKVNRVLTGRGSGPTRLIASRKCALELILQLYRLSIIDGFTDSTKVKKEKNTGLEPVEVCLSPGLESQIFNVLYKLNITPVKVDPQIKSEEPILLLNNTVNDYVVSSNLQLPRVIAWTPPTADWNLWESPYVDEEPREAISPDEIHAPREPVQDRENLPIDDFKEEIIDMINKNSVCIIQGSTGCGKTTQVGQFILNDYIERGRGAFCNVIVTQPRRISAITVADRVAYERGEELGMSVGYSVRFKSVIPRPHGSILFCTVGTLLKRLQYGLKGVSHVIIDEVHERDMNTDFILAVLRDVANTYPDFRLILMSATVDTDLFSNYFSGCPVLEIPGRLFPVQEYFLEDILELVNFLPSVDLEKCEISENSGQSHADEEDFVAEDGEENGNLKINPDHSSDTKKYQSLLDDPKINQDLIIEILRYIRNLEVKGAVLVFLPGWAAIDSLMCRLRDTPDFSGPDYVILPLHSCLLAEEQELVFQEVPPNVTKIILSTNIAESSVTIKDIVYVIDSCKVKIKKVMSSKNLTEFQTVWASKTNLEQRRGRAGRLRPGYCFRLCSKEEYEALETYATPEILRLPLYELALSVKMLGLGEIGQYLSKVIEPPPLDAVKEAVVLLREMKYLDHIDELTPLGQITGRLPIEPKLGKMVILGILFKCSNAVITLATDINNISAVFLNCTENGKLSAKQKRFSGIRCSDHMAAVNAFQTWERATLTGTNVELCDSKELSESFLQLTANAKNQLLSLLKNCCGFPQETLMDQAYNYNKPDPNLDMVTALLPVGLYPNIAYHTSKRSLLTTDYQYSSINKRSVNIGYLSNFFHYPFFVYGERVKADGIICRDVTMVTPLSLLLFGARKVEYVKGLVKLDGWINLKMDPFIASCIVSLRAALENLIIKAASDPSKIMNLSDTEIMLLRTVKSLCRFSAGRYRNLALNFRENSQDIFMSPECPVIPWAYQGQGNYHSWWNIPNVLTLEEDPRNQGAGTSGVTSPIIEGSLYMPETVGTGQAIQIQGTLDTTERTDTRQPENTRYPSYDRSRPRNAVGPRNYGHSRNPEYYRANLEDGRRN